ncbi:adenosylcobinamide-GDP ribazoletransferase [Aeromicrobium massiliense]|uniref:adenosylcobinamide-GDP ribazoletransferase n=1 Tax=Aeromicrobium massiliense TaxID=1464554 RepID=UPI000A67BAC2|nr:adenosylcobinamide-GDP ribazoletransferase [Aeromicrobium massiliense]
MTSSRPASRLVDGARMAVGTFTAVPVPAPGSTGRDVAAVAMLLAPLAVVPLGLLVGLTLWLGREAGLSPWAVAALAVGLLALGSRALHLDGLADTADGLTASYDRERALAVMRTGDVGPAGAAALVVVLAVQAGALVTLASDPWGPLLAAVLVCVSRGAVLVSAAAGVPGARRDGLGAATSGVVPVPVAVVTGMGLATLSLAVGLLTDLAWWRGPVAVVVALVAVGVLVRRCVTRLGGVTGDVHGASVEVALAALLLAVS